MRAASTSEDLSEPRNPLPYAVGLGLLGAAMLAGLVLDAPEVLIGAPLAFVFAWALYRLPLKVGALGLFALAVLCEGFEQPLAHGFTVPLLGPLAHALLANGPLHAPLIDVLTLVLWALSLARSKERWVSQTASVRMLDASLAVSAAVVIGLELLGIARHGDIGESLWQLRHVLLFAVRAALLLRALDGTVAELKIVAVLLIGVAVVKSLIGIGFLYGYVYPRGLDVEYTTSHTDTLLFVPVLAMFFNLLVERWSWKTFFRGLPWVSVVLLGMVLNDRRLAYVCLACAAVATLALTPWTRLKRTMMRAVLCLGPFVPLYLLAGWSSTGGKVFAVARLVKSLVVGDPSQGNQPDYRDLENTNVLFSWSNHPVLPWGFGHKMEVLFPLPDISRWFPAWEFHPHNQFLWLVTIAGPVGFTLMMLPQVLTVFLCARAHRVSMGLYDRVAVLTGIAIVIAFFCQVYGDMGTLSWTVTWMAALAAAFAGKIAVRVGAMPGAARASAALV